MSTINNDSNVHSELRRFAMNEFLTNDNYKNMLDSGKLGNDGHYNEDGHLVDDLLLTNAISENKEQDILDKTRYVKEVISYVNINSNARHLVTTNQINIDDLKYEFQEYSDFETLWNDISSFQSSLSSTDVYDSTHTFAPFSIIVGSDPSAVNITPFNRHFQITLLDVSDTEHILTPQGAEIFDIFIPINNNGQSSKIYTISDLQNAIQTSLNETINSLAETQLNNHPDPDNLFAVNAYVDPLINPDRVTIELSITPPIYQFTCKFLAIVNIYSAHDVELLTSYQAEYLSQTTQDRYQYYPKPNSYAINIQKSFSNVKSLRIVSSEIPNTDRIINNRNNHIQFKIVDTTKPPPTMFDPYTQNILMTDPSGSIIWDLYLSPGNYTVSELANEIQTQINALVFNQVGISNLFTIMVDEVKGIFEIKTDPPYQFSWYFVVDKDSRWRNLYSMLGFKYPFSSPNSSYVNVFDNLIVVNVGTIPQPVYIKDLKAPYKSFNLRKSNIIWLYLNGYENIYDTITQNRYFSKFTIDNVKNNKVAFDTFTDCIFMFNDVPLPLLRLFDVRFYDEVGLPYDFNNVDHSFTLEIVHELDKLVGTDYNSKRGTGNKSMARLVQ
jgi:hypothetical protein